MADQIGARCCVNVAGTPYGPRWDGGYKENFSEEGSLDIKLFEQLASREHSDMPMIIEHLNTDEEYIASVKEVQKTLGLNL